MIREIKIPKKNLETLLKRFNKFSKKAEKYGMEIPKINILSETIEQKTIPDFFARATGKINAVRQIGIPFSIVRLEAIDPWIKDWKCLGTKFITADKDKKHVVILTNDEIPDKYKINSLDCEHCNTKRRRLSTFILQNKNTNETKEVGATCVEDFLGTNDPRILESLETYYKIIKEVENAAFDDWEFSGQPIAIENTKTIIALARKIIKEKGFLSSKDVQYSNEKPTWHYVQISLNQSLSEEPEFIPMITDYDFADNLIQWIKSSDCIISNSEFKNKAIDCIDGKGINKERIAILSSIVNMYENYLKKQPIINEYKNLMEKSEPIGEIGSRLNLVVSILNSYPYYHDFGQGQVFDMKDGDGNFIIWKSSTIQNNIKVGNTYEIKGTVKKYSTAKRKNITGIETVLTRVSIIKDFGLTKNNEKQKEKSSEELLDDILNIKIKF